MGPPRECPLEEESDDHDDDEDELVRENEDSERLSCAAHVCMLDWCAGLVGRRIAGSPLLYVGSEHQPSEKLMNSC
ncbi:hypothetical protein NDU88_003505 [Pleurodeles waltl]|uniref:Uncharacterized protein n=1 Tax=Pleurodeles waltl TaxID=8319 RepID=A0AAV7NKU5_PLEWA|nr:hypothetical protein NDU88_003505 [Pleurodeles waltl]